MTITKATINALNAAVIAWNAHRHEAGVSDIKDAYTRELDTHADQWGQCRYGAMQPHPTD